MKLRGLSIQSGLGLAKAPYEPFKSYLGKLFSGIVPYGELDPRVVLEKRNTCDGCIYGANRYSFMVYRQLGVDSRDWHAMLHSTRFNNGPTGEIHIVSMMHAKLYNTEDVSTSPTRGGTWILLAGDAFSMGNVYRSEGSVGTDYTEHTVVVTTNGGEIWFMTAGVTDAGIQDYTVKIGGVEIDPCNYSIATKKIDNALTGNFSHEEYYIRLAQDLDAGTYVVRIDPSGATNGTAHRMYDIAMYAVNPAVAGDPTTDPFLLVGPDEGYPCQIMGYQDDNQKLWPLCGGGVESSSLFGLYNHDYSFIEDIGADSIIGGIHGRMDDHTDLSILVDDTEIATAYKDNDTDQMTRWTGNRIVVTYKVKGHLDADPGTDVIEFTALTTFTKDYREYQVTTELLEDVDLEILYAPQPMLVSQARDGIWETSGNCITSEKLDGKLRSLSILGDEDDYGLQKVNIPMGDTNGDVLAFATYGDDYGYIFEITDPTTYYSREGDEDKNYFQIVDSEERRKGYFSSIRNTDPVAHLQGEVIGPIVYRDRAIITSGLQAQMPSGWDYAFNDAIGLWTANYGVTESGGLVTSWANQRSGGLYPMEASGDTRPTYNSTGWFGHPCIDFDGTDDRLISELGDYYTGEFKSLTMIIAFEWITLGSGYRAPCGIGGNGTSSRYMFQFTASNYYNFIIADYNEGGGDVTHMASLASYSSSGEAGNKETISFVIDADSYKSTAYRNRIDLGRHAMWDDIDIAPIPSDFDDFLVDRTTLGAGSRYAIYHCNIRVAGFCIFPRALSDEESLRAEYALIQRGWIA